MNASLLTMFIMKKVKNNTTMSSRELTRMLEYSGMETTNYHNATKKMKDEKLAIATGGKGSKILKITPPGETYVINLIKEINSCLNQSQNE